MSISESYMLRRNLQNLPIRVDVKPVADKAQAKGGRD
jgi:hypothetical protein